MQLMSANRDGGRVRRHESEVPRGVPECKHSIMYSHRHSETRWGSHPIRTPTARAAGSRPTFCATGAPWPPSPPVARTVEEAPHRQHRRGPQQPERALDHQLQRCNSKRVGKSKPRWAQGTRLPDFFFWGGVACPPGLRAWVKRAGAPGHPQPRPPRPAPPRSTQPRSLT